MHRVYSIEFTATDEIPLNRWITDMHAAQPTEHRIVAAVAELERISGFPAVWVFQATDGCKHYRETKFIASELRSFIAKRRRIERRMLFSAQRKQTTGQRRAA